VNRVARATKAAFGTQTGLCRHSNRSLFASRNRAGKRFAEARDWGGILGDSGRFQVTETARSRVSAGKAAESQRPFRRRQKTGVAQECVVEVAGLERTTNRLFRSVRIALVELSKKSHKVTKFDGTSGTRPTRPRKLPGPLKLRQPVGQLVEAPGASEISGLGPRGFLSRERR
jgi:hypothetical protein